MYLFMKVCLSPDIILCGWLGSKHQLATFNSWNLNNTRIGYNNTRYGVLRTQKLNKNLLRIQSSKVCVQNNEETDWSLFWNLIHSFVVDWAQDTN